MIMQPTSIVIRSYFSRSSLTLNSRFKVRHVPSIYIYFRNLKGVATNFVCKYFMGCTCHLISVSYGDKQVLTHDLNTAYN